MPKEDSRSLNVPISRSWLVACFKCVVGNIENFGSFGSNELSTNTIVGSGEERAAETISLERLAHGAERIGGMVVRSAQVRKVLKTIARLSPYKATVLISGESGTGKELVARALHTLGPVPAGPFITFNCSNLVETLAESQLFGHVRGAFTDAREESQGYFRSANGGTLFLDEIGELPLKLQPKLLRAVETHEIQPVGSSHSHKVDIRLVAATNRDLRAMVKAGQFRDDLYYRLNSTAIFIPPLRDRREAIPAFIAHFIEHYGTAFHKDIEHISTAAVEMLCAYQWPGNVRELAHALESAVILSEGGKIGVSDLPEYVLAGGGSEMIDIQDNAGTGGSETQRAGNHSSIFGPEPAGFLLDDVIKKTLVRSLEETEGNRRRAATLLGVSRSTLYRMLARYGLGENPRRISTVHTL
ncbi:MAG: two component, sigma54 specific, transcriptional regulator, Fis family [Candidatus Binatus sp.]|nr:two component, sigma54 specific, transcriptional regulator, Fis family [Candidatus Binatus sp.]